MLPGKRWIAGFSRKTCSSRSGSVAAISAASSRPSRCFSLSGPENAVGTVTCWSRTKPIEERERLGGEQLVGLGRFR